MAIKLTRIPWGKRVDGRVCACVWVCEPWNQALTSYTKWSIYVKEVVHRLVLEPLAPSRSHFLRFPISWQIGACPSEMTINQPTNHSPSRITPIPFSSFRGRPPPPVFARLRGPVWRSVKFVIAPASLGLRTDLFLLRLHVGRSALRHQAL